MSESKKTDQQENKKSKSKVLKVPVESFYGTGKRKSAIAKVWLFKGSGQIQVNRQSVSEFFGEVYFSSSITQSLVKLNIANKYDCFVRTLGGGKSGQADAIKLGISRALISMNPEFRPALKEDGLLTRDDRIKERKKYGRKRARKGYQFRKR